MTVVNMLQVESLETRSHSATQLTSGNGGKRKPYQAQHPHIQHHRRLRGEPQRRADTDPDITVEVEDSPTSPISNPNDPFEQHFLAAAALHATDKSLKVGHDGKVRASSFRNDKPKPHVAVRDPELSQSSNYSSSPNLLFPKDDLHLDHRHTDGRDAPLRRVRSFKSTSKGGVINRGDSLRRKGSHKNVHHGSINGYDTPKLADSHAAAAASDIDKKPEEAHGVSYFKVQVLGAPGCGKTSITNQFMSSEYANSFDNMNVDEVERTLTIQLDGEESTMEFIDALPWDDTVDHDIDVSADAYVVVYSVIDRSTYDAAVQSLYKLRHGLGTDRTIVLVGNKIDLVRKRKVKKDDVASICRTYDCIQFETSAALNHKVDELLIEMLKSIRHKLNPELYACPESPTLTSPSESKGAKGLLVRLYRRLSRKGRPKSKK